MKQIPDFLFASSSLLLLLSILQFIPETMSMTEAESADTPPDPRDKVLVFGGNGFIGSELVHTLLQKDAFDISIVSRGNWYFDSETRIKPFVHHITCDRENSDLEYCTELIKLIDESHFKYIFDFSAYKPEVLLQSVDILNNKTDLYVYISSDSIYEVCEDPGEYNGGLSKESDGVRPESEDERDRLNDADEYGNEKLLGEEVRNSQWSCPIQFNQ